MTLTQARDFLRSELLAVAAAVVPGQQAVVTHDPGPVDPSVLSDGSGAASVCTVTVQTGEPATADPGAALAAAAAELTARGWQAEIAPVESGHHRVAAFRAGYDIAVHGWDGEWRITLTGQTPAP